MLPIDRVEAAGDGIKRNPGATAVWIETKQTRPFKAPGGYLFKLGDPESVEWYANGRLATRAEVQHSIETGLPLLMEAVAKEPTAARRAGAEFDLRRRLHAVASLVEEIPE